MGDILKSLWQPSLESSQNILTLKEEIDGGEASFCQPFGPKLFLKSKLKEFRIGSEWSLIIIKMPIRVTNDMLTVSDPVWIPFYKKSRSLELRSKQTNFLKHVPKGVNKMAEISFDIVIEILMIFGPF